MFTKPGKKPFSLALLIRFRKTFPRLIFTSLLNCHPRSPESVVREGEVLRELLEMSEKREKLGAMLERDRARYRREDEDIEAQMRAKGISLGDVATSTSAMADILKMA